MNVGFMQIAITIAFLSASLGMIAGYHVAYKHYLKSITGTIRALRKLETGEATK